MADVDDALTLTGELLIQSFDQDGNLLQTVDIPNLVTTIGKGVMAGRMLGSPTFAAMSNMAIGSGTTAANVADSALQTETGRVALTSTTVTGNQIVYVATFGAGVGVGSVSEAGVLNAGSGGNLFSHTVFSVISKGSLDSLTITWTITIN